MRIINQHRNRSANFDNVEIHVDDAGIFAVGDHKILLGEYDTKERASEIFQEIHAVYSGNVKLDKGSEFSDTEITVYEMPIS